MQKRFKASAFLSLALLPLRRVQLIKEATKVDGKHLDFQSALTYRVSVYQNGNEISYFGHRVDKPKGSLKCS